MSLTRIEKALEASDFPRVSGDEPWSVLTGRARPIFSPRERG